MDIFLGDLIFDFLLALGLFTLIIITVFVTKNFVNIWINRKLIHLSVSPAILAYMYFFKEPYVFFVFATLFTVVLILPHLKSMELSWFQEKKNYGEVFFSLSFAALSISFWGLDRILTGTVMLFMAIGDSITGMIRSKFVKKRSKHWTGTVAMFASCTVIGYVLLGNIGLLLASIATIAEYQPWLDDNLAVPAVTMLFGVLLL